MLRPLHLPVKCINGSHFSPGSSNQKPHPGDSCRGSAVGSRVGSLWCHLVRLDDLVSGSDCSTSLVKGCTELMSTSLPERKDVGTVCGLERRGWARGLPTLAAQPQNLPRIWDRAREAKGSRGRKGEG